MGWKACKIGKVRKIFWQTWICWTSLPALEWGLCSRPDDRLWAESAVCSLQNPVALRVPMSLRTADSLSNGFENPLESHLHSADGFFREHTTLPTSEVCRFAGRHRQVYDQGGANWPALLTLYASTYKSSSKLTGRITMNAKRYRICQSVHSFDCVYYSVSKYTP